MTANELTPVSEIDHLDEDKPIRGQNYVCLSFVSPEETLLQKEAFVFSKFMGSIATALEEMLHGLKTKYPQDAGSIDVIRENHSHFFTATEMQEQYRFFKEVHGTDLDSEFSEKHTFQTNVRGIKVRGVFDTLKEAQVRAEVLKRMGDKFDIYVAQVGCWCPWSPNPADLTDQEYAETQLNTLMSKYKQNMELKDEMYMKRKDEKVKQARDEVADTKAKSTVEPSPPVAA
jgi:hypothetical protein